MIVRTGGRLVEGRVAWHETERGRMRPSIVVGDREVAPASVEVVEVDRDRGEALAAAGFRVIRSD